MYLKKNINLLQGHEIYCNSLAASSFPPAVSRQVDINATGAAYVINSKHTDTFKPLYTTSC